MDFPYQNCLSDFDLDFLDSGATSKRTSPVPQCAIARKKGIARLKDKLKSVSQVVIKAKQTAEILDEFQKETQEIKAELEETKILLFEKNEEHKVICDERNTYFNQATEYSNELQIAKARIKAYEEKEYETKLKDKTIDGYIKQVKGLQAEMELVMDSKKQNDKGTALAVLRANKSKEIVEKKLARVLRDYVYPLTKKPDRWLQGLLKKYLNTTPNQEESPRNDPLRMMSPLNFDHKEDENMMEKHSDATANIVAYPTKSKEEIIDCTGPSLFSSPAPHRNISIDLECIGSVDTGRGSSLAFSDGEKSFQSPDYYMHDSPINNVLNLCNRCNVTKKDASTSPIPCKTSDITNSIKIHSIITKRDASTSPLPTERRNVATDTAGIQFESFAHRKKINASTSPEKQHIDTILECGSCISKNISVTGTLNHNGRETTTKLLGVPIFESPPTPVKLRDKITSNMDGVVNNMNGVENPAFMASIVSDESETNYRDVTNPQGTNSEKKDKVTSDISDEIVRSHVDIIDGLAKDLMSNQIDESTRDFSNLTSLQSPTTPEKLLNKAMSNIDTNNIFKCNTELLFSPTNDATVSETDRRLEIHPSNQSPTTPVQLIEEISPNTEEVVHYVDKMHSLIEEATIPLESEHYDEDTVDCMSILSNERSSTPEQHQDNMIIEIAHKEDLGATINENYDVTSTDNYTIFYEEIPTNSTKPLALDKRTYERGMPGSPQQEKDCLTSNTSKHFKSDTSTDNEIQTIFSEMRIHRLLSPIPAPPPRRISQLRRLSNDITSIAEDVNERINLVRNNLKNAFAPLLLLPQYGERIAERLCSEPNREIFRNFLDLSIDKTRTRQANTLELAVSQPNENIYSLFNPTEKNINSAADDMVLEDLELEKNDQTTLNNHNKKTDSICYKNKEFHTEVKNKDSSHIPDTVAPVRKHITTVQSSQSTHVTNSNINSKGCGSNDEADVPQNYLEADSQVLCRKSNNCKKENLPSQNTHFADLNRKLIRWSPNDDDDISQNYLESDEIELSRSNNKCKKENLPSQKSQIVDSNRKSSHSSNDGADVPQNHLKVDDQILSRKNNNGKKETLPSQNTHIADFNEKTTRFSSNDDVDISQNYLKSDDQVLGRINNSCQNEETSEDLQNKSNTIKPRKLSKLEKLRMKMVPKSKIKGDIKPKRKKPIFIPLPKNHLTFENSDIIATQKKKVTEADTSASLNEESVYKKAVEVMAASKIVGIKKVPRIVVEDCSITMKESPLFQRTNKDIAENLDKSQSHIEKIKSNKRNLLKEFESVPDAASSIQKVKVPATSSFADKLEPLPVKRKRSANSSHGSANEAQSSNTNDALLGHELKRKKIEMSNSDSPYKHQLITLKDLGLQPDVINAIETIRSRRISYSTCKSSLESTDIVNKTLDSTNIVNKTLGSTDIVNKTLDFPNIANKTLGSTDIVNKTLDFPNIANKTLGSTDTVNKMLVSTNIVNKTLDFPNIVNKTLGSTDTVNKMLDSTNIVNETLDSKINNNNTTSNSESSDVSSNRQEGKIDNTVETEGSKIIDNKRRSSRLNSLEKANQNAIIDFNEIIYKPINKKNQTPVKEHNNAEASTRQLRSSNVKQIRTGSEIEQDIPVQSTPKKARCQKRSECSDKKVSTTSTATGPFEHNNVVSYDDLSMFTNQEDCPQVVHEQNRTTEVEVSVISYSNNILCRSIEQHGRLKINYIPKKFPESKVKEICNKLESSISHLVEIPHEVRIGPIKRLVSDIKGWNVKLFLMGFMEFLRNPERKNELFKKITRPPAPAMTVTEEILLYLISELQHCNEYQDIDKKILMNIEYALFAINKTGEEFGVIAAMSHFYSLLCRSYQKFSQLRLFILDAMYCLQYKSIVLIKQCLEVWMSVLPLAHMGVAKTPLISCVVYLLHFFKCEDKSDSIQEIRFILYKKYSYDFSSWNELKILDMFKSAITELKDNPLERKMLRLALIILAKRNGPKWCQNNIVKNILKPMIEDSSTPVVAKLFCISVLGPLLKPYPNNMKLHCEMITDYLLDMLTETHCQKTQETIVTSLVCLHKQNKRVLAYLLQWNPKKVSPEFELVLRDYVRTKTVKTWKTVLSQIDT